MKKMEMEFVGIRTLEDVVRNLPINYKLHYSVEVEYNPYTSCVVATVTPNREGFGSGWDTFQDSLVFALIEQHEDVEWERLHTLKAEQEYREEGEELWRQILEPLPRLTPR